MWSGLQPELLNVHAWYAPQGQNNNVPMTLPQETMEVGSRIMDSRTLCQIITLLDSDLHLLSATCIKATAILILVIYRNHLVRSLLSTLGRGTMDIPLRPAGITVNPLLEATHRKVSLTGLPQVGVPKNPCQLPPFRAVLPSNQGALATRSGSVICIQPLPLSL